MKVFQGLSFSQTIFNKINGTILKPALFSTILLFASVNANAATYTFTDLGTNFNPTAVNNVGQVIGQSITATGDRRASIWSGGTRTELGTLGGNTSVANSINDSGQVVGYSTTSTGQTHATLWNSTTATDLGTYGITTESIARDINNLGQIVGSSYDAGTFTNSRGILWQGASATDTGLTSANAINNLGQIVGSNNFSPALWNGSTITSLLSVCGSGSCPSNAKDINDAGIIVGSVNLTEPSVVVWNANGQNIIGLYQYIPGYTTLGSGINNSGQFITHVNGFSQFQNPSQFDFLRNVDGSAENLLSVFQRFFVTQSGQFLNMDQNSLLGTTAINDLGWITGNYNGHGYLLSIVNPSAVPVPAAAWLFASGLGAFGVAKRRSKQT
jgi:probable HAF family extracellular repeat protein